MPNWVLHCAALFVLSGLLLVWAAWLQAAASSYSHCRVSYHSLSRLIAWHYTGHDDMPRAVLQYVLSMFVITQGSMMGTVQVPNEMTDV